jgi:hypothetical protein
LYFERLGCGLSGGRLRIMILRGWTQSVMFDLVQLLFSLSFLILRIPIGIALSIRSMLQVYAAVSAHNADELTGGAAATLTCTLFIPFVCLANAMNLIWARVIVSKMLEALGLVKVKPRKAE